MRMAPRPRPLLQLHVVQRTLDPPQRRLRLVLLLTVRKANCQTAGRYRTINPKAIRTANVAAARIPNLRRSAKT